LYLAVQLPAAASLQRTTAVLDQIDEILKVTPGVQYYTGVAGFNLLSSVFTTYNGVYFLTLKPWDERWPIGLNARVILFDLHRRLAGAARAPRPSLPPPPAPPPRA